MKLFYKILIISSIIIFLAVILFISILTWKIPYNNLYLKIFQKSFNTIVSPMHPAQSNLIADVAEIGNWANGAQCQFFVGQFRLSTLSKESIKRSYFKESVSSGVNFIEEDIFNHSPWFKWKEKYLKNYKLKENESVYLIWTADEDSLPDGDIRCH